ncbi:MAG: TetR/AcrR family transcriptional regulator [Lachnospiraceae bacterium]
MSNTYLTGEQTKRRILKESKKLFYKNGFHDTTYNDISAAAKINRALIPYHFQSKQILGKEIYEKIMAEFTDTIDTLLDISQFSSDFACVFHTVAYYRLLHNEHFSRFVYQLLAEDNTSLFDTESEKQQIIGLGSKFSQLDDSTLDTLARIQIGIKKEMIQLIQDSGNTIDADELAAMQLNMIMGYAGYSRKKIDELFNAAVEVVNLLSFHFSSSFSVEVTYK